MISWNRTYSFNSELLSTYLHKIRESFVLGNDNKKEATSNELDSQET